MAELITLTGSPSLKVQVMCEGIRYTAALGQATAHSMPNYYPYRFKEGEHDPTGKGIVTIPYLINTPDGTEIRILGNGDSPWHVEGNLEQGYLLIADRSAAAVLCDPELIEQAALKETSLFTLANRCGIAPAEDFVERFIHEDREVRTHGC